MRLKVRNIYADFQFNWNGELQYFEIIFKYQPFCQQVLCLLQYLIFLQICQASAALDTLQDNQLHMMAPGNAGFQDPIKTIMLSINQIFHPIAIADFCFNQKTCMNCK